MNAPRLVKRPLDIFLIFCLVTFAFVSFVMEMYAVFGVDLSQTTSPFGRAWYFYASSWDPLFLNPPLYLRVMCGVDAFVFGPFYLIVAYGLARARDWVRIPGIILVSAVVYSTLIYFGVEFIGERSRANLEMVALVNCPYTAIPLILGYRLRKPLCFPT